MKFNILMTLKHCYDLQANTDENYLFQIDVTPLNL